MIISGYAMVYRLITYIPSSVTRDLLEESGPERLRAIWKFAFFENSFLLSNNGPT